MTGIANSGALIIMGPGMRVRELNTGREATVESVILDNSCSDLDCCGGPFPDTAYLAFDCGHMLDVSSNYDGEWEGYEILSAPETPREPRFSPIPQPILSVDDLRLLLERCKPQAVSLVPDATENSVVIVREGDSRIGRVGWCVIESEPAVKSMLEKLAELPPRPTKIHEEPFLKDPQVNLRVLDVATGCPGTICQVSFSQDSQRYEALVGIDWDCGHFESRLAYEDEGVHGVALLPEATAAGPAAES